MKKMNFGFHKSVKKPLDSSEHGIQDSASGGATSASIDSNSSSSTQYHHQSLSRLPPTTYEDSNYQLMQQDTMRFLLEQSARDHEARILDLTATLETRDTEIARLRSGLEQKDGERMQLRQQIDLLLLVQKQQRIDEERIDDKDSSSSSSAMEVSGSAAHEVSMKEEGEDDRVSQLESELLAIKDKHAEESKQWLHHKATLVKRIAMLSRAESECEEAQLKVQSLTTEIDQLKVQSEQVVPSAALKDENTQLMRKLADLESSFASEERTQGWRIDDDDDDSSRAALLSELESVRRESSELSAECSVLRAELQATKDGFAIERTSFLRDYNALVERSRQESELGDERIALLTSKVASLTAHQQQLLKEDDRAAAAAVKLSDQMEQQKSPPREDNSCSSDPSGDPNAMKQQQQRQLGSIEEKQQPSVAFHNQQPPFRGSTADIIAIDELKRENATLKRLLDDNFKRWLVEKQALEDRIVAVERELKQTKNGTAAVESSVSSSSDYLCLQEDLENVVMRYDFVNSELKRREGELDELRNSMQANSMTTMRVEFDRIIREQNNLLSDFQDKLAESEAKKSSLNRRISILENLQSDLEELVRSSNQEKRTLKMELDHEVLSKESYLVQLKSMHADLDAKAATVRDMRTEHAAELSRVRDELRNALNKQEFLRSELSRREQELAAQSTALLSKESSLSELLRQVSDLKSEVTAISDDRHKIVSALTASEKQLKHSLQSEISSRQSIELELVRRNSALQSDRLVLEKVQMDFDKSQIRVAELTEELAQSKQRMRAANIELLRKNEDIANYQSTVAQAEASDSKLRYEVSHLNEQVLRQSSEIAALQLKVALTEDGLRAELKGKVDRIIDLQSRKDESDFQSEQNKSLYLLTKAELSKASMELSFMQKRFEESEGLRVKDKEALYASSSELARCRSELNDCRRQLSACTDEMQQGRSTIASLTSALRDSKTSNDYLESSAKGEKTRLESTVSELSAKNAALNERIARLESQSRRSSDEMQAMELDRRRLHSSLEELQALSSDTTARKEAEVLHLEDDLKRVMMKCDSLSAEVAKNENALSHRSNLLVVRDAEVDRLTHALRLAEAQVQHKNSLLATDEEAIQKSRAQIEQLSSDLLLSQESVAKLTNELRDSAEQVSRLQSDKGSLQSQVDGLHATIRTATSEGASASEEILSLRNRISSLSDEGLATASRLHAELEDANRKLGDSQLQLKNVQLEFKKLETHSDANATAALKEIKATKDEVAALSIRLQASTTAFEKDIESDRGQIQALTDSKSLLESKNRRLQSAVDTKSKDLLLLSDQLAALQLQTAALDDQLRLLTAATNEADRDNAQLKTSLAAKQAECSDLLEQNESLRSQLRGSSEQTASSVEELAKLKSLLNTSEEKVVEFGQAKTKLEWKIKSLTDDSRKVSLQLQIAQEDIQENRKELERCRDLVSKKTADYQSLFNELQQTKAQMNAFNMEALARGEIAIPEYEKDYDFESAPDIVYSFQMV